MGGGKSRALCEQAFQTALEHPGILIPIFRKKHVAITDTTRRTMMQQVIPSELQAYSKINQSGGKDFIRLPNESEIHFLGLDDPVTRFSAEYGMALFDEAHEMSEEEVVLVNTRLRQRCQACVRAGTRTCPHYPHTLALGFNPENPGHWLYRWFIAGAERTDSGYRKDELWTMDAVAPLGDADFIFASALDNPYLPEGYVDRELGGMPELLRRRYLGGEWIFTSGICFFDTDALTTYDVRRPEYRFDFRSLGEGEKARRQRSATGRIHVYEEPVEGVSYAIGADVATGRGQDFSAAYVIRLDEAQLVAEFRAKLDADLFAEQLHFLGRWYGTALIAVETGGGYGDAVIVPLRDGKGARPPYPKLHRHVLATRADLPQVKPYGYPMNSHTRPLVLNALAKAIRERALPFLPQALHDECHTFVHRDTLPSPRSQDGCNDDCVFAAAIALEMYRQRGHHPEREERRRAYNEGRKRRINVNPFNRRHAEALVTADIEARYPRGS